jgi:peroxiredoxin
MQAEHEAFRRLDATILVVVKDNEQAVRTYWKEHGLAYHGLADPDGLVSARYRQQWKLHKLGRMPAQFVVGCDGAIVLAHYGSGMSDIVDNARVLALLRGLPGCGGAGSGRPER